MYGVNNGLVHVFLSILGVISADYRKRNEASDAEGTLQSRCYQLFVSKSIRRTCYWDNVTDG